MFKRTIQRYGQTPEPVTPYQKAAQAWDERIGSARVQAKNWRLMAFGSLALVLRARGRASLAIGAEPRRSLRRGSGQARRRRAPLALQSSPTIRPTRRSPIFSRISSPMSARFPSIRSWSRKNWLNAYAMATDHAAVFSTIRAHERPVQIHRQAHGFGCMSQAWCACRIPPSR